MTALAIPGIARQRPYIGAQGNLSIAHAKYTVDAAQNDTLDLLLLPRGARIIDSVVLVTALGASVTMNVGIQAVGAGAKSAAAVLNSAADVSAAVFVRRNVTGKFIDSDLTLDDDDYYLRLTLAGANPASGTFEVYVIYQFVGTK